MELNYAIVSADIVLDIVIDRSRTGLHCGNSANIIAHEVCG